MKRAKGAGRWPYGQKPLKKPLTSKERVLKRVPLAWAYKTFLGDWYIFYRTDIDGDPHQLGYGTTARQAWANAAANLKGKWK